MLSPSPEMPVISIGAEESGMLGPLPFSLFYGHPHRPQGLAYRTPLLMLGREWMDKMTDVDPVVREASDLCWV